MKKVLKKSYFQVKSSCALLHLHNYNYSPTPERALQPRGGEANNLNGRSQLGGSVLGSVPSSAQHS